VVLEAMPTDERIVYKLNTGRGVQAKTQDERTIIKMMKLWQLSRG
jgi:hypothetical protein